MTDPANPTRRARARALLTFTLGPLMLGLEATAGAARRLPPWGAYVLSALCFLLDGGFF